MPDLERPVHAKPEKFENSAFTLKTHQMFSVHTTLEKFEKATILGHFALLFEEDSGRERDHTIIVLSSFRKALF